MEFKLSCTQGTLTRVSSYNRKQCRIGRVRSDIILNDPYCSKEHAEFYMNFDMSLWIKDLGSTNGTYVNGERITKRKVSKGDVVKIGHTQFTILEEVVLKTGLL